MPGLLIRDGRTRLPAVLLLLLAVAAPSAAHSHGSSFSGGSVHVRSYSRRDGTYVHSHYRSAPGTRSTYGYSRSYGYGFSSPAPAPGGDQEDPTPAYAQPYTPDQPPQRADDTSQRAFGVTLCVLFIGMMLFALGKVVSQPDQRQRPVTQASSATRGRYLKVCPRCQRATALDTRHCAGCGHTFRTQFTLPT